MNRLVKRYVGRRDIIDNSGKIIAYIERDPYHAAYKHVTEEIGAPHVFLNLNEVRDYYGICK